VFVFVQEENLSLSGGSAQFKNEHRSAATRERAKEFLSRTCTLATADRQHTKVEKRERKAASALLWQPLSLLKVKEE